MWQGGGVLGSGMAATHRACVALLGISPSMWRAMVWLAWEAFLGQLWAEFDLGPKRKVEAHELLYKFH